MTPILIEEAIPSDDAALRDLLRRTPMPGKVELTFEREPSFFAACALNGSDTHTLVARAEGKIVAVACRSSRNVHLNGVPQRVGYLGQLRIDRAYQGRWIVSRGFAQLHNLHRRDLVPGYLIAITDDNKLATGVLVRKPRPGFPTLAPVADLRTCAFRVRRNRPALRTDLALTPLTESEVPEFLAFLNKINASRQFAPVWTESSFRRLGPLGLTLNDVVLARRQRTLVGVAALWDQSSLKQTVIRSYNGWLRLAAPLLALPSPGQRLREACVSLLAVAEDDLQTFRALLRHLYRTARARGLQYLLLGLDKRDPFLPVALEGKPRVYPSKLYLAHWGSTVSLVPDARPAYADIATY